MLLYLPGLDMMATILNKDTWLVCRQKLRSQTIEGGGVNISVYN